MGTHAGHAHVGDACWPVSSRALSMHARDSLALQLGWAGRQLGPRGRAAVDGGGWMGGEVRFRGRALKLGMASHMAQYGKCHFVSVAKVERPMASRLDRGTAVPPPPTRASERLQRNETPMISVGNNVLYENSFVSSIMCYKQQQYCHG